MGITYRLLMVVPVALVIVLTSGCGPAATAQVSEANQAVPPETAVYYAVKYAQTTWPGSSPHLEGDPTEVRGSSPMFRGCYETDTSTKHLPCTMVVISIGRRAETAEGRPRTSRMTCHLGTRRGEWGRG